MTQRKTLTEKQQAIVSKLENRYGIDGERVLFLNSRDANEPWIPPSLLEQIARQMDGFKSSSVQHDKFIYETSQVVYTATVTDTKDRVFTRTGVAMIGEVNGDIEADLDVDYLAQGRALSAALNAAGFNPVKSEMIVAFADEPPTYGNQTIEQYAVESAAVQRTKDLKAIHAEATKQGFILGKDYTRYRQKLDELFGVKTAAVLDANDRTVLINYLKSYNEPSVKIDEFDLELI